MLSNFKRLENVKGSFYESLIGRLSPLLIQLLLTATVESKEFGIIAPLLIYSSVSMIFVDGGLVLSLNRQVDYENQLSRFQFVSVLSGFIIFLIFILITLFATTELFERVVFIGYSVNSLLLSITLLSKSDIQRKGEYWILSKTQLFSSILTLVFIASLVGLSLTNYLIIVIAKVLPNIFFFLSLLIKRKVVKWKVISINEILTIYKESIVYIIPSLSVSVGRDIFFVAASGQTSTSSLGNLERILFFYKAGVQFVSNVLNRVFFYKHAKLSRKERLLNIRSEVFLILTISIVVSLLMAAFTIVVPLLFGITINSVVLILALLSCGHLGYSVGLHLLVFENKVFYILIELLLGFGLTMIAFYNFDLNQYIFLRQSLYVLCFVFMSLILLRFGFKKDRR